MLGDLPCQVTELGVPIRCCWRTSYESRRARRLASSSSTAGSPGTSRPPTWPAVGLGVWVEFSLSNLVSPASTADRLPRLLDLAPTGRLLVGGDGHGVPETHWFALGVVRDGWSVMRDRLGAASRAGRLDGVERNVFADNARRLYRL